MIDEPRNESATAKTPGAAGTVIAVQDLDAKDLRSNCSSRVQDERQTCQLTHGATSVCTEQHPPDSTDRNPILLHSGQTHVTRAEASWHAKPSAQSNDVSYSAAISDSAHSR